MRVLNCISMINLKYVIILIAFACVASCKGNKNYDPALLVGKWNQDSASVRHDPYDILFILKDGRFYNFSIENGGGLIDSGKIVGDDSLISSHNERQIKLIDSNNLKIGGNWNNTDYYYKRSAFSEDIEQELKEHLQGAAFRTQIIGWWKSLPSKALIKMPNTDKYFNQVTLNFTEDGQANFYLEHRLDSLVSCSFHARQDEVLLSYGCVIEPAFIRIEGTRKMRLLMGRHNSDSITLERLSVIK